jgi:hypothetical protein
MSLLVNKQDGFLANSLWRETAHRLCVGPTLPRRTEGWTAAALLGHDAGQQLRQAADDQGNAVRFPL